MSNPALWAGTDVAVAGKASLVEFEAGLGLSGVAAGVAHEAKGPAIFASLRAVPATGRQNRETPVDGAPGRQETAGVGPQQTGELRLTSVRPASGEEEPSGHAAPMAVTQAMPAAEMGLTPAIPGALERGTRPSDGRTVASPSDAPEANKTGDVPSDGQEQGPFGSAPAAVPNPVGLGARQDMGPAGRATNAANALQTPLELLPASPAPTSPSTICGCRRCRRRR